MDPSSFEFQTKIVCFDVHAYRVALGSRGPHQAGSPGLRNGEEDVDLYSIEIDRGIFSAEPDHFSSGFSHHVGIV